MFLKTSPSVMRALKSARSYICKEENQYIFSSSNFRNPVLPRGLKVLDVPLFEATDESLKVVGARLIHGPDEVTCEKGNFEIVKWPVKGWRQLDPETGDEAGTTEGPFQVNWEGDYYVATNLAVATSNNIYLDGLATLPELASREVSPTKASSSSSKSILLWMSDYHPDGGQSFFPELSPSSSAIAASALPFVVCLGPASCGDHVRPGDMVAFAVPAGKGVYLGPGTWHNGVYVHPAHTAGGPVTFRTRQGRVHARVSCSWAAEFGTLLRVPLVL
jgi:hypothetical protein